LQPIAIVLLPGLDGTGRLFSPLLTHLPGYLRPIVVRYPLVPQSYAELLPLVSASLPQDEPFIILGESFSGPLAIMAADRRPQGLCGVILDATFVKNPSYLSASVIRPFLLAFLFRLLPSPLTARLLLGRSADPIIAREVASVIDEVPAAVTAMRVREALAVDVTGPLRRLDVPILYLRGRRDHIIVPARNARQIARLGRDVRIREFGTSHMILQTRPGESATAIAEFCARVGSRVPSN
jgi:pimeloyl-ACP methyl ester carboxylesterase